MEDDRLKKQLDTLWEKVQQNLQAPADRPRPSDLVSAFEQAQSEIQAESLKLLQTRFQKEKRYWEDLVASKEETIAGMKGEIEKAEEKNLALKLRIEELQHSESQTVQQSFGALELQKKTLGRRIEQYEQEIEDAKRRIHELELNLRDEQELRGKLQKEWEEKEKRWADDASKREIEIQQTKQELFQRRQKELQEITQLNETIRSLQSQATESKNLSETEITGLQNLLAERQAELAKRTEELTEVRAQFDKEREERRLAAVERERETVLMEENKKRLTEQLLNREMKIKEMEETLDRVIQERAAREETLKKKEEEIFVQDEALRKRREEWVESIRGQSGQQLDISAKVLDLLGKLETRQAGRPALPAAGRPATPPLSAASVAPAENSQPAAGWSRPLSWIPRGLRFLNREKGWALVIAGLMLFSMTFLLLFYENEGRKTARAQKHLAEGNESYIKGNLDQSAQSLERAYRLDPQNSIVRDSYALVLGEVAHREFRDGKLEDALAHTETLYKILPEDPDVVELHSSILQAMGRAGLGKPIRPVAPAIAPSLSPEPPTASKTEAPPAPAEEIKPDEPTAEAPAPDEPSSENRQESQ